MKFYFLTLFPEVFPPLLEASLLGKAQKKGLVSYETVQIRDFALDKHHTVDDTPYGGGEGMLLRADVLKSAWHSVASRPPASPSTPRKTATVLLSPQGALFTQAKAKQWAQDYTDLIFICGHYEGVDQRFTDLCVDYEISIGDYVLTGGELPALVLADAITRVLPGVVGNPRSLSQDSLEKGLLKYPQYTRPRVFEEKEVPSVLLGGNHQSIQLWRDAQCELQTKQKRPDLWELYLRRNKC